MARIAECGSVAASSNEIPAGIGSKAFSRATRTRRRHRHLGVQVGEHPVAGREPGDARPDRLDHARDVDAEAIISVRATQ